MKKFGVFFFVLFLSFNIAYAQSQPKKLSKKRNLCQRLARALKVRAYLIKELGSGFKLKSIDEGEVLDEGFSPKSKMINIVFRDEAGESQHVLNKKRFYDPSKSFGPGASLAFEGYESEDGSKELLLIRVVEPGELSEEEIDKIYNDVKKEFGHWSKRPSE